MKCVKTQDAVGHVLCHDITQIIKDVKKGTAFRKGHIVTEEDIPVLLSLGKDNLYIWEKTEGILHENEAAEYLRDICMNENMIQSEVKEGKIELIAEIDGLLKIDVDKLRAVNSLGEMMIATRHTNTTVKKGDKLVGTRIIPLLIEQEKMEKAINSYNERLSEIRAGRANPAILNKVKIDYYGTQTPINQVAAVSVPEARLIVIQPWDASVLKEIEKAILASDIGINPNNDGKVIRLTFPELTEERRKEIVKDVKKMAEEAKVAVRNVRREGIDKAKADQKAGDMTEDELKGAENEIQKLTDKYVEEIDKIAETKEKEVMSV